VTIGEDFHRQVGDGKVRTTLYKVRWEGYLTSPVWTSTYGVHCVKIVRSDLKTCQTVEIMGRHECKEDSASSSFRREQDCDMLEPRNDIKLFFGY
jgi:hypothetical protein